MNWLAKYGIPVLVVLFFFSCSSKDGQITVGTNYSTIGTHYTDTISLNTSSVLVDDSVATSLRVSLTSTIAYTGYLQVGQYEDNGTNSVGSVRAEAYTQLRLANENVDLSAVSSVADIDSAFLYLDYQAYSYGDTNDLQTFEVYEMTSALDPAATYFCWSPAPSISASPIGSISATAVTPHTKGAGGKTILKIPILDAWAYNVLAAGGTTSDDFVANRVKGIAIMTQASPGGAVIRLNLVSGNTKLVIYHNDTRSYTLTMTTNGQGYTRIVGDRSGTLYSTLMPKVELSSSLTNEVTYMQAGVGVKTKVEIPYLSAFKDAVGHNVVINKAYLMIPVQSGTTSNNMGSSLGIYMIRTDASNNLAENSVGTTAYVQALNYAQNGSGHELFASYDVTNNWYQADITDYVRDMLNGRLPNSGFYISPNSNAVSVERTLLNSGSLMLTDRMTLKLYYTVKQ